jgi:hypothetical protein
MHAGDDGVGPLVRPSLITLKGASRSPAHRRKNATPGELILAPIVAAGIVGLTSLLPSVFGILAWDRSKGSRELVRVDRLGQNKGNRELTRVGRLGQNKGNRELTRVGRAVARLSEI